MITLSPKEIKYNLNYQPYYKANESKKYYRNRYKKAEYTFVLVYIIFYPRIILIYTAREKI